MVIRKKGKLSWSTKEIQSRNKMNNVRVFGHNIQVRACAYIAIAFLRVAFSKKSELNCT